MSKLLLIIIVGGFITFGILNLSLNSTTTAGSENAVDVFSTNKASDISNSMAQMILSQLADSNSWRSSTPITQNLFGGTASYTIIDTVILPDSLVKINVTGIYFSKTSNVTVYAQVKKGGILPSFPIGLLSGGDLTLHDENTITSYNNPNLNADVHCNGNLYFHNSNSITGFVTYTSSSNVSVDPSQWNYVVPNQNPNGLPNHYSTDPITVPTFKPSDYLGSATVVYNSNVSWSNQTITLGTINNPQIIYCKQNLTMSQATIKGYGIIIVEGITTIGDNSTMNPSNSGIYLYGNSDITVHDDNTLCMHFYSNTELTFHDSNILYGSAIAVGDLQLSHDHNQIKYIPPDNTFLSHANSSQITFNYGFAQNRLNVKYWYQ